MIPTDDSKDPICVVDFFQRVASVLWHLHWVTLYTFFPWPRKTGSNCAVSVNCSLIVEFGGCETAGCLQNEEQLWLVGATSGHPIRAPHQRRVGKSLLRIRSRLVEGGRFQISQSMFRCDCLPKKDHYLMFWSRRCMSVNIPIK